MRSIRKVTIKTSTTSTHGPISVLVYKSQTTVPRELETVEGQWSLHSHIKRGGQRSPFLCRVEVMEVISLTFLIGLFFLRSIRKVAILTSTTSTHGYMDSKKRPPILVGHAFGSVVFVGFGNHWLCQWRCLAKSFSCKHRAKRATSKKLNQREH